MSDAPPGPVAQECVEGYVYARRTGRFLVLRRPPQRDRIWVPVSGKVDPTDADWPSALRRELAEETALVAPVALEDLDWHVTFPSAHGETWRLHAYAVSVDEEFVPVLSEEHEAFAWLSPEEAIGRLHYEDNREAVRRVVARRNGPDSAPRAEGNV